MIDLPPIPHPQSEPFPGEPLLADGWAYRDMPRVTEETFNKFLEIVGQENTRFLTIAKYRGPNATMRGQLLISPTGMERLKAHAVTRPHRVSE